MVNSIHLWWNQQIPFNKQAGVVLSSLIYAVNKKYWKAGDKWLLACPSHLLGFCTKKNIRAILMLSFVLMARKTWKWNICVSQQSLSGSGIWFWDLGRKEKGIRYIYVLRKKDHKSMRMTVIMINKGFTSPDDKHQDSTPSGDHLP